jgi:hypothetical protein
VATFGPGQNTQSDAAAERLAGRQRRTLPSHPGTVAYHRSISLSFGPRIGKMPIVFISLLSYFKVRKTLGYGGVGGVVGAKGRRDPLLQIGRRQQESGEEWDGAQAA